MKCDIDHTNITTITLEHNDGVTRMLNDKGLVIEMAHVDDSTMILAMLHQTFMARLHMWDSMSSNFSIELTIHEVVK